MKSDKLQVYISQRVRECRKKEKISQEKLSEMAGLGIKAVQNIENLKYDFKIQTIEKIISSLNISVEEFFNFQTSDNATSLEELIENIDVLSDEKQKKIITSFNEIIKNMI